MFVVFVDLWIEPGKMDVFLPLMAANAAASRQEPGCLQFDVVRPDHDPEMVFLYEVYQDAAAFEAHLDTAHFAEFDAASADLITAKTVLKGARMP